MINNNQRYDRPKACRTFLVRIALVYLLSFVPDDQKTQAVAVRHGNEEVFLLSTAGGTFTLPAKYNGYKAQKGYCNANNNWVAGIMVKNSSILRKTII